MNRIDLTERDWIVNSKYGPACGNLSIDIMRTSPTLKNRDAIRWTYSLMIEVYPSEKGISYYGERACGQALPAILSARPEPKFVFPLVEIGDEIETPFGVFQVQWASRTDHDNLKLIEIK